MTATDHGLRNRSRLKTVTYPLALCVLAVALSACGAAATGATGSAKNKVAHTAHATPTASGSGEATATPMSTRSPSSSPIHVAQSVVPRPPAVDTLTESAIKKAAPSVVLVQTESGLGSGVILTGNGYIVTNHHVVSGARNVKVTLATGKTFKATIKGNDPLDDLAILKINASGLPTATFATSATLQLGETVLAVGNPLGITHTVTEGIVSATARTVNEGQGGGRIPNAIQTSAPINPGNSGGALINLAGQVVGIPTLTAVDPEFNAPAQGIGFAIPSNKVVSIATQIMKYGTVKHTGQAALGIEATSVSASLAQQYSLPVKHGVLVAKVLSGSGAAKAGMTGGDVIVKLDGTTIGSESDLLDVMARHGPGDHVHVTYVTKTGATKTATVTLGELPANATG
jgi:S1-C subfamily serine protease